MSRLLFHQRGTLRRLAMGTGMRRASLATTATTSSVSSTVADASVAQKLHSGPYSVIRVRPGTVPLTKEQLDALTTFHPVNHLPVAIYTPRMAMVDALCAPGQPLGTTVTEEIVADLHARGIIGDRGAAKLREEIEIRKQAKEHAESSERFFWRIGVPLLLLVGLNALRVEMEHAKHLPEMRRKYVPYPELNVRRKKYPWGNNTLFHNPAVNYDPDNPWPADGYLPGDVKPAEGHGDAHH